MDGETKQVAERLIQKNLDSIARSAWHPEIYKQLVADAIVELLRNKKTVTTEELIAYLQQIETQTADNILEHNRAQAALAFVQDSLQKT